jgi:hypothetical protein
VKLFAVAPLTCVAEPTCTKEPVVTNVATRDVTLIAYGTVAAIDDPLMVAVTVGLRPWKLKAVTALAELAVRGNSAPAMTPELAELVAPVDPAIVNWLAVTPVNV